MEQGAQVISKGFPLDAVRFVNTLIEVFAGYFVAVGGAAISGMLSKTVDCAAARKRAEPAHELPLPEE